MEYLNVKEIKEIEKEILVNFADFCDEHDLTYMLCGGTLLGAIRHKGFIPWDDDIDVLMPRPDYERFYELVNENPINNRYELFSWKNKKGIYPFYKLVDNQTEVIEKYINEKCKTGIWVDIFPIDGCPIETRKVKKIYRKVRFVRNLIGLVNSQPGVGTTKTAAVIKTLLIPFVKHIDTYKLADWADSFSKRYSLADSPCVAGIVWGYGPQEKMPRSFLETVEVEFEGRIFKAPKEWDLYLSNLYGDYMILPPEQKRIVHDMKARWKR